MTFEEACSEVAKKHKLGTKLVTGHRVGYFAEAAELYAASLKAENEEMLAVLEKEAEYELYGNAIASVERIKKWFKGYKRKQK